MSDLRPHNFVVDLLGTKIPAEVRFWKMVKAGSANRCWVWSGPSVRHGYGHFTVGYRQYPSHRWSYERFYGPIPSGLVVMHKCDNPPCVNPRHLALGTQRDNRQDSIGKGRGYGGKNHHAFKITESKARSIRKAYAKGDVTQRQLAARFFVSQSVISEVITKKATWTARDE